jgi:hypothetical protein
MRATLKHRNEIQHINRKFQFLPTYDRHPIRFSTQAIDDDKNYFDWLLPLG